MRLFVALVPPPDVIDHLRDLTSPLQTAAPQLRWTRPGQWHLTLAFLGDVADRTRLDLERRLGGVASHNSPILVSFAGGGRFGHRVLWIGVGGDRPGLVRIADSVRAAARHCGLPTEHRTYRPHLTLARARDSTDLRPLVEQLSAAQTRTWTGSELHLVRSRLGAGPGGTSVHETAHSWPLLG